MDIEDVLKARQIIIKKHGSKKPEHDIKNSMVCPVCKKGGLFYSISSFNGHVWGKCTTRNCMEWME